jgi:hypothetical protein
VTLLVLAYLYGLLPLIPTLTTAASFGFKLEEGFGVWWGFYCVDKSSWWRIGRSAHFRTRQSITMCDTWRLTAVYPVTILPTMILTAGLSVIALSTLYSNVGNPSARIHPSKRQWLTTAYLLLCVMGVSAFLIVEQSLGWEAEWWPRVFESTWRNDPYHA